MKVVDTVVIGAGILGCFAARNLAKWNMSVLLLEEKEDVCTGVTRANSAVVYAGYDNQPGSLKAAMTVRGNARFERLCQELEAPFIRRGSLMVSFGPRADKMLRKKYDIGMKNQVPDLQLLSGKEARIREPHLSEHVTSALYAPTTGTVNPWQLGIAAYENAMENGCEAWLKTRVLSIQKGDSDYVIETNRESVACKVILNCAGLSADQIQEMLFAPTVRLVLDAASFLVLDRQTEVPEHIIFYESEEARKGFTAVTTVEGNLLLESSKYPLKGEKFRTSLEALEGLRSVVSQVLPQVDFNTVIRSFGAVRPNPHYVVKRGGEFVPDGKSIGSFVIENPAPGFYSLIGIKTPGLTCSDELGSYLAEKAADYLGASPKQDFLPKHKMITLVHKMDFKEREALAHQNPEYGEIVCQCEDITKGEIREAILKGAVSVDGVKRRVGAGMGKCQGSRCSQIILKMLEEARNGSL